MQFRTLAAFCLGCLFAFLCAAGIELAKPTPVSAQADVKWEYKYAGVQTLDSDGKAGWEAYAIWYGGDRQGNLQYFMKRHAK
ncbi:MAG: hypothetical protein HZB16_14985 [Armatimonadetes bacterium]|nr:hypothetical protein [Armatimonadota bacterium]